jgi:hypothetical protein|tara:strand:- start:264 stop:1499 length:1236 start_codon:yes stop_codon:yes gene_type:complete
VVNKVNIINYFYKNKSNIFLTILFVFIINIILKSETLYNFIWESQYGLFGDHKEVINWIKWNYLGFDIFQDNINFRKMSYGPILLLLPFDIKLEIFYLNYLPYIIIVFLLSSITFLITPKNKIGYVVLFLSICNPSTLLLIERMNFDIFIFLITIFIIFNRFYFINWILISFLSLVKFYPVILGINIMLENKNRKILMLILIILTFSLLSILYLYSNFEKYQLILEATYYKAGYHFLFSLKTIPKILKYLFHWNYIFLVITFLIIFTLLTTYYYKVVKKNKLIDLINVYSLETRLFLLGSYILLICYLVFSNYFYREIFLIMLFPFLFKFHNIKSIKFFIHFIIYRYIYLFIYGYINVHDNIAHIDDVRYFSEEFLFIITLKGIIDIFLMSFIGSILFLISKKLIYRFKFK